MTQAGAMGKNNKAWPIFIEQSAYHGYPRFEVLELISRPRVFWFSCLNVSFIFIYVNDHPVDIGPPHYAISDEDKAKLDTTVEMPIPNNLRPEYCIEYDKKEC